MEKILVKLLVHGVAITGLVVALSNAAIGSALMAALVIGVVAYVLGDLLILPRTGNAVATVSDAVLVFLMLWAINAAADWTLSLTDILIVTAVAGVFEYFYHIWLLRDHDPVRKQQT